MNKQEKPLFELVDPEVLERFIARVGYVSMDATGTDGWSDLVDKLADGADRVRPIADDTVRLVKGRMGLYVG